MQPQLHYSTTGRLGNDHHDWTPWWCLDIQNIQNIQIWAQWQCSMGIRPKHAEHNEKKDCKQHHILFASKVFSFKLSVSTRSKCPETSHCSFSSQSVCFIWVGSNKKLQEARSLACFHMFSPVGVSKQCFDVRPFFQGPLGPEATGWWCGKGCEFQAWIEKMLFQTARSCSAQLVGGFNPSEKYERQLGWLFPIYGENIKCSKPPTSQYFGNGFGKYRDSNTAVKDRSGRSTRAWFGRKCRHTRVNKTGSLYSPGSTLPLILWWPCESAKAWASGRLQKRERLKLHRV